MPYKKEPGSCPACNPTTQTACPECGNTFQHEGMGMLLAIADLLTISFAHLNLVPTSNKKS
jgi:RNA polymerase subunit RPABC4/transcription elongation factor Spt4